MPIHNSQHNAMDLVEQQADNGTGIGQRHKDGIHLVDLKISNTSHFRQGTQSQNRNRSPVHRVNRVYNKTTTLKGYGKVSTIKTY